MQAQPPIAAVMSWYSDASTPSATTPSRADDAELSPTVPARSHEVVVSSAAAPVQFGPLPEHATVGTQSEEDMDVNHDVD